MRKITIALFSLWLVALHQRINLNSSPTEEVELVQPQVASIHHSGFSSGDYRQEIVAEAYELGGIEFVSMLECENGNRDTKAKGDGGKSHGLCMVNTRRHKEPLNPERNDWNYQLSVCYEKWKGGTKFYGPSRLIGGKRCSEVVKSRFIL